MPDETPVRKVGDYEFLDRMAVGGMGELWRVRHVTLDAVYVAKQLREEYREDEEFLKRFFHEAKLVANLRHPNIVQVFGYDEEQTLYLMEYVEGMDLDHLMRTRRVLRFREKRTIIEVVADAIGYAHREIDLIHRDIKPSNVLIAISSPDDPIRRSSIKLTDFGIARVLSVDQRMTMSSGMVMGTVHYMAPEQFEGEAHKYSDVYAIGVLYYQLLTGRLPFDGPTAFVIRDKHRQQVPPAPRELSPSVPLEDSDLVMKCLAKDPKDRFQDGMDLYEALVSMAPSGRTVRMPHTRSAPPDGTMVTEVTRQVKPTGLLEDTQQTIAARTAEDVTQATIPLKKRRKEKVAPEAAPAAAPKARPRLRLVKVSLIAVAALLLAVLTAPLYLPSRYEIRWSTLRSDPLDTPNGIHIEVCPKVGMGMMWRSAGVVMDKAPEPWSNWTTFFDGVDVRFSDGLYREFVVRVRRPAEGAFVDFGGATFEQIAESYGVTIKEDVTRIGDYIKVVFTPSRFAAAKHVSDITRFVDRVTALLDRTEGVDFDRSQLNTYTRAVQALTTTAHALADGDVSAAKESFRSVQALVEQMQPGDLRALPPNYFFRDTVRTSIAELETRLKDAESLIAAAEPRADSPAAIAATAVACRRAGDAVARLLQFAPGHGAFEKITDESAGDLETAIANLGTTLPPSILTARRYLTRLDDIMEHTPPSRLEGPYRAAGVTMLDALLSAAGQLEQAEWLGAFYEADQLAFFARARAFWLQVHRARFDEAVRLCEELANTHNAKSATLSPTRANLDEAEQSFQAIRTALEAIRKAKNITDDQKRLPTGLLGTACLRHAAFLFQVPPESIEEEQTRTATIAKLLEDGLHKFPGASADAVADAEALQSIFKLAGGARRALAACLAANFATADSYSGDLRTLVDAVTAYGRLAAQSARHADNPSYRTALAPFTKLASPSCRDFTLANAATCWLLANARKHVSQDDHQQALSLLGPFAENAVLRPLMPEPIATRTDKLTKLVDVFAQGADDAPKTRWDRRLQAKALLDLGIPPAGAIGSVPPQYRGQETQWAAMYDLMRGLVDLYRTAIEGEAKLRELEAAIGTFFVDDKPNPETATPEAVQAALTSFAALRGAKQCTAQDQTVRLSQVSRALDQLKTRVTGTAEKIAELMAKPDPKGALDAIEQGRAILGAARELDLTRQVLTMWIEQGVKLADAKKHADAATTYDAIAKHTQVRRHAIDAGIRGALADARKAASFSRGQLALAKGADGLADALAQFREAGDYRNAARLVEQIGSFQTAQAEKDPFQAAEALGKLAARGDLEPALKKAVSAEAESRKKTLGGSADACLAAFHQGLAKGGWEGAVDAKALQDELQPIRDFLGQVTGLKVTVAPEPNTVTVDAPKRNLVITRKRTLAFDYKLADTARYPMSIEQTIKWTVTYRGGKWLITAWEETD